MLFETYKTINKAKSAEKGRHDLEKKNISRRQFLTSGAAAVFGAALTKLSGRSYAQETAQNAGNDQDLEILPLDILSGASLDGDSESESFGAAFREDGYSLTQYFPVFPGLSLTLTRGIWVGFNRNLRPNASLQGASGKAQKMHLIIPEGVYFLRGACPDKNGLPQVWTQSLERYLHRCCESMPELSAYTEITELHFDQRSRKNVNGEFDPDELECPSMGDLFFSPIGTDIIVCFRNANITPVVRIGENYTFTQRQNLFTPHFSPGFAWFHCKTSDVCSALEAGFGTVDGFIRQLTVEELRAADPRVFVRFPSEVSNTLNAARIRTIGVSKSCRRNFTVVHLTDIHGDMDSAHAIYEYADRIKADFVALTGDNCPSRAHNGFDIINTLIRNARTPTVYSIGNHDVADLTDAEACELGITPILTKLNASSEHPWYFRDLQWEGSTVRVISLYPFCDRAETRVHGYYSQEQLQWLCETMASTPDEGHIFILRHFSHHKPIPSEDGLMFNDYGSNSTEEGLNLWLSMDRDPVPEIVDAFNEKNYIHTQFTGRLQNGSEEINVEYDFSDRGNAEFVAYMTGHVHCDHVGYVRDTKTSQAVLGSLCNVGVKGSAEYHAYSSANCHRDYGTDSQIAFNVFTFNFQKRKIYVARVGNGSFRDREKTWMELSY